MNIRRQGIAALSALVLMLFTAIDCFAAPVVTSGFDPSATDYGAVRWRNFANFAGDKEIRIGLVPLTPGGSFSTGDFVWPAGSQTHVKFIYDGSTNLRTEVGSGPTVVTYTLPAMPAGPVNYFRINLCNSIQSAVKLNTVSLDGDSLGSFGFPVGCESWSVINVDKSGGFTFEGDIHFVNLQSGFDQSLIEVRFGNYVPSAANAPVVSNVAVMPVPVLLNGPATLTASASDAGHGNNPVSGAEYSLNGGPWTAMDAQDGAFDGVSEDVEAGFTATQKGGNEVCVRATDTLGNVGTPQCQTFSVTYQFEGFFAPIDNLMMNVAKAGQAVPVKWRLTDYNGAPIADPASFAGLWTYPISCTDSSSLSTDAVEEYAAGSSGLQYSGDGYWQFNWKTPKSYANQCFAMYVLYDTGIASPVATFKFSR